MVFYPGCLKSTCNGKLASQLDWRKLIREDTINLKEVVKKQGGNGLGVVLLLLKLDFSEL
tara:strand:- start:955 stop:1134 length:180 start_codon:yes stop_codon:yes gene_type:complete